jgi:hypothetical protein
MAVVAGSCPFPGDNASAFHDFAWRGGDVRGAAPFPLTARISAD